MKMLNKDNYMQKVKRYVENAMEEPERDEDYIKGLIHGATIGKNSETKDELVRTLLRIGLTELDTPGVSYSFVRGISATLKEAMKLEGELNLEKFKVITPVHQIVKDDKNNPIPLKYVQGEYEELWTMPEILTTDMTYVQYAKEVK